MNEQGQACSLGRKQLDDFRSSLFVAQLEALAGQVPPLKRKDPVGFAKKNASKVIIYAWVNDDSTKRAYESSDDAYRVFRKMLESGHPPDDWDQLLLEARAESIPMPPAAPRDPAPGA